MFVNARMQEEAEMLPTRIRTYRAGWFACFMFAAFFFVSCCFGADLRLGIVGTDTSHSVEFTKLFNDAGSNGHVPGARVVAAFRGGSPDIAESRDRIGRFSEELSGTWHIPFVQRIGELCPLVDGILLESVDGRTHLDQFRQAVACGKPVFIDKPLASTLADALELDRVAAAAKVPWFSSSSLRFGPVQGMRAGDVAGAFVWGPGPMEEHHQLDLSWYGIHTVEMLFTVMGTGVEQVTRTYSPEADVVTGVWTGGRIGTLRVVRPYSSYGAVVYHAGGHVVANDNVAVGYSPLLEEIVKFMRTGVAPVPHAETLEMFRFMDAAQQSRERGGVTVSVGR